MRKLKFHEKKLLKKVNFLEFKQKRRHRKAAVTQRSSLVERDDYKKHNMGVVPTKKGLVKCENVSLSAFCRQRLPTVMVKLKFAKHLKEAVTHIEQGHVRVGPETVTDPAFLVTRNMEDFVTWVDISKIKKKV